MEMKDAEEFHVSPDEDDDDEKTDKKKRPVVRTPIDLQRLKLEKLMKNPDKPVVIPEPPRQKDFMLSVPNFVRNVMGSSAGAGSGEFHVYRHLRRKEYARQKHIQAKSTREQMDDDYHNKLEQNKLNAESKTAKKRAKRQKKKQKMNQRGKKPKMDSRNGSGSPGESSESESEGEEMEEDKSDNEEKQEEGNVEGNPAQPEEKPEQKEPDDVAPLKDSPDSRLQSNQEKTNTSGENPEKEEESTEDNQKASEVDKTTEENPEPLV